MAPPAERQASPSGITEQEAREFHGYFVQLMMVFVAIALVAHFLVWSWRPWIPA